MIAQSSLEDGKKADSNQLSTQANNKAVNHSDNDVHCKNNTAQDETDEKPMKKVAKQSILRKIRHLMPEALLSKTGECNHHHGCFENVVRDALKRFLIGFCLSMLTKNITKIFKPAKLIRNL